MILQLGSIFSNALGGLLEAATPLALETGKFFLQRELTRVQAKDQKKAIAAQAVQALNTPGISVARVGGTTQPVGGRVQRSTFLPAASTPAQSPIGNIPLVPVQSPYVLNGMGANPAARALGFGGAQVNPSFADLRSTTVANGNGAIVGPAAPKYAMGADGKALKFWNSPTPGEGYLPLSQARALYGSKVRPPFYRFNRMSGGFEKIKARRMNPFNFRAADRARKRIARTYDAVKEVMQISNASEKGVRCGGKVVKFRTKKRRKKSC